MLYKIVMTSWGGTRRDMFRRMSYDEALEMCEFYDWVACPGGGYEWDLEIKEDVEQLVEVE